MRGLIASIPVILASLAFSQSQTAPAQLPEMSDILSVLNPRELGPSTMGGRVTDIAVFNKEPRIFFVASASGGLWKTQNAGITFEPVFDKESTVSLGAVAVQQNNSNVLWVGTGEYTSRNSVSWGDGVYKSTDGGKTWKNMGLGATMHISRIVIDPRDPDTVYVAALGRLWGSNPERGVYKTTDGGKTWNLMLFADENTGIGDLVMNPKNPDELLAATWERQRRPWTFISGGSRSGIFKSKDAGKTWKQVSKGLPTTRTGRIGLSYFFSDPKIITACVENKDAGGIYRSKDGGESWTQQSKVNPRPFYFSRIAQDPVELKRIYMPGVTLLLSEDDGKTFKAMDSSIHVDHHAMWVNPNDNNHLLIGTDGGVGQSRDRGLKWQQLRGLNMAQFYMVGYDTRRPYWVYGGLQDNGSWGIPTQTRDGSVMAHHAVNVGGGDGFYVQVDPTDWRIVYSESQGGAISRVNQQTGEEKFIRPSVKGDKLRFNWNTPFQLSPHNTQTLYFGANKVFKSTNRGDSWRAISGDLTTNDPFKQKPGVGSVSPENTGAEAHCTITSLAESPITPGLIWAGTDDGQLWVTKDDGNNWTNVVSNIPGLPKYLWCSRITPSKYVEGRAYACFDGHRSNNFNPYVYVTEDFGATWRPLSDGLALNDSLYVIREGLKNRNLLFLGSEMNLYVSLNLGKSWSRVPKSLFPTVAVHDLAIQPKEQDLLIATHGRGMWSFDISLLEQMKAEAFEAPAAIFAPQDVVALGKVDPYEWGGDEGFRSPNTQPGTRIVFWTKSADKAAKILISDVSGNRSRSYEIDAKAGFNFIRWDGKVASRLVPGEYRITLTVGGKEYTTVGKVAEATDLP